MHGTLTEGGCMIVEKWLKIGCAIVAVSFFLVWVMELDAFARVGGGRSTGSRGSRSYSAPNRTYSTPSPSQPSGIHRPSPSQPMATPTSQQSSFWRSLAMGIAGGFLGSLLFSGLSHGMGTGGFGGSGIGLLEILVFGFLIYYLYAHFKRRREVEESSVVSYRTQTPSSVEQPMTYVSPSQQQQYYANDVDEGIRHIRQMDPSFDEGRFKDTAMDIFFRVQGAWANRDMNSVKHLLTDEMFGILQGDAERLKAEKKFNKLDNIAIRSTELTEVWQEGGQDFITVRFLASLLDYTVSESGEVLEGSTTEPVKFEEYWTFTRPVGNHQWQLCAINQAE